MTQKTNLISLQQHTLRRIGIAWVQPERAIIGNPLTGDVFVTNSNTPGQVFIHLAGEDPHAYTVAYKGNFRKSDLRNGRPVLVKKIVGGYVLDQVDPSPDAVYSEGMEEIPERNPVHLSQLMFGGTLHPELNSMRLFVAGGMYGDDWVSDQFTADFSASPNDTDSNPIDIPSTANRAIGVLVQVEGATGTLTYKQSSEFDAILGLPQAYKADLLPIVDTDRFRSGYFKLIKGMTQITYDHIWEVPELIRAAQQRFPIDLTSKITIATNEQLVVSAFTISTGGSLVVNGRIKIV